MKSCRRPFGSRKGNAMIEFALSATVLIYAFTGVFQFGYSMYLYNELEAAVRAGARYASYATISNSGNNAQDAGWQTKVKNVVVYGTPSPTGSPTPVVPGLAVGNVSATATFSANVPAYVNVSVSSYALDAIVKTFTLTNKPLLTMPFMGQYCIASGSSC